MALETKREPYSISRAKKQHFLRLYGKTEWNIFVSFGLATESFEELPSIQSVSLDHCDTDALCDEASLVFAMWLEDEAKSHIDLITHDANYKVIDAQRSVVNLGVLFYDTQAPTRYNE